MATFTIDLLSGNAFLFNKEFAATGGTGGGAVLAYDEVNMFNELPSASSNNGIIYVVRESSGQYVLNRKEAGLYFSNGATWRRLGDIPSFFSSDRFQVYESSDTGGTTGLNFVTSGITQGNFRQLEIQDKDGTIAYLVDLESKVNTSAFADYTGTTAPATFLNKTDFDSYSATTFSLIQSKQNKLTAGSGISIDNDTIKLDLPNSLQIINTSGETDINKIEPTKIDWNEINYTGDSLNFSGGSRIYIKESGNYLISYMLTFKNNSNNKITIGSVVRKNNLEDITQLSSSSYSNDSNNSRGTNSTTNYKVSLSNGDYIELSAFRIGNSGQTSLIKNTTWLNIIKII